MIAGMGGLGAEVAKNVILAGVKGLTMVDHKLVRDVCTPASLPLRHCDTHFQTLTVLQSQNLF